MDSPLAWEGQLPQSLEACDGRIQGRPTAPVKTWAPRSRPMTQPRRGPLAVPSLYMYTVYASVEAEGRVQGPRDRPPNETCPWVVWLWAHLSARGTRSVLPQPSEASGVRESGRFF